MELDEQENMLDDVISCLSENDKKELDTCKAIMESTIEMYGDIGKLALAIIGIQYSKETF